jgi:hypothetical protein
MTSHLEREIRLSEKSEYENLYHWSLQEIDGDGNQVVEDQIPWGWTLYFSAGELRYSTSIESKIDYGEDHSPGSKSVVEGEIISGKLHPAFYNDGRREDVATFSMFGTNRNIRNFDLSIMLKGDESDESCKLWGCPSYTYENDFRDFTTDDTLAVSLILSADKFDRLGKMIRAQEVDEATLWLRGVSGFYSGCSPSISTTHVKVLTAHPEQKVVSPDNCPIDPPRLGEVEEFCLQVSKHCALKLKLDLPR